jgi:hypothetical protein
VEEGFSTHQEQLLQRGTQFHFHYVLFGHGLAAKGSAAAAPYEARSVSGRADLPGNGVAITVGRWRSSGADALVGSANLQASTLLHELSHNLWGFHGGITREAAFAPTDIGVAIVPRPNCNPNKQSSLNYLYQSAGLLDAQGIFRVNLSGQVVTADTGAQDEPGLKENLGLGSGNTAYRLRWYAPLSNVQANFRTPSGAPIALSAAKAHCDGLTPLELRKFRSCAWTAQGRRQPSCKNACRLGLRQNNRIPEQFFGY